MQGGTDRGVSEVLGAILVFAILVSALGVYQSVAVPNANEDVELAHSQEIQGDMVELRNGIRRSTGAGTGDTVSLRLGVNYPPRTLALNPSSGSGILRTTRPDTITVANAESDAADIRDVWNGTNRTYTTRAVAFTPQYNYYREAGTTRIEGTIAYNDFGENAVPLSGQRLVDGREITLVTLEGTLATSQATSLAVDVEPVSVSRSTVSVRNTSDPINVTIPTRIPEEVWVENLLDGQLDDPDPTTCADTRTDDVTDDDTTGAFVAQCVYHNDDDSTPANLTLTFEPDTTYQFDVARVTVGPSDDPEPTPQYVTVVRGDGQSVPEDGTHEVVFEVRDRYDNPVANAPVDMDLVPAAQGVLTVNGNTADSLSDVRTDEDGRLVVTYEAPGKISSSPVPVKIRTTLADGFVGYDESGPDNATADLRVINASKINRTAPSFNPEIGLVIESTSFDSANLNITLKNTGSEAREITGIRYVFFFGESQNSGRPKSPYAILQSPNRNLSLSGATRPVSIVVDPGRNETLEFDVEIQDRNKGDSIQAGDYFVFSLIIDGERRETYFISPQSESS